MRYLTTTLGILSIHLFANVALADDGKLFLFQPTAVDKNTYIASTQIKAMQVGFDLAIQAFKEKFPTLECKPDITVNFDMHTDASLFEEVKRVSHGPGRKVMSGVTRTNFARLAAAAAAGNDTIGISSAAD